MSKDIATNNAMFTAEGTEHLAADTFTLPKLRLAQSNSAVMSPKDDKYNPEVKEGDFYTDTDIYPTVKVRVIRVDHILMVNTDDKKREFVYSAHISKKSEIVKDVDKKRVSRDKDGHVVTELFKFHVLIDGQPIQEENVHLLYLRPTSIPAVKKWLTDMRRLRVNPTTGEIDPQGQPLATWGGLWELTPKVTADGTNSWASLSGAKFVGIGISNEEAMEIKGLYDTVKEAVESQPLTTQPTQTIGIDSNLAY